MRLQLVMVIVVEALDGCVFDRAVHALNLAVGPRMVRLCQTMLDTVGLTNHVEAHGPGICGVAIARLLSELNAVFGKNCVELIGHGLEHLL